MEEALRASQRALEAGEVPVGAVVVCDGRIVGRGWNRNIADHDPTLHAEIVALRDAVRATGNHRLVDCDLFLHRTLRHVRRCDGAAPNQTPEFTAPTIQGGRIQSVIKCCIIRS